MKLRIIPVDAYIVHWRIVAAKNIRDSLTDKPFPYASVIENYDGVHQCSSIFIEILRLHMDLTYRRRKTIVAA